MCLAPEGWRAGVCLATRGCRAQALIKALMKALMEAIARKLLPNEAPQVATYRDLMPCVKRDGFVLRRGNILARGTAHNVSEHLGVFVLAKRAAAADETEDSSAVNGNAVATIRQADRCTRSACSHWCAPSPPVGCTAVSLMAEHDDAALQVTEGERAVGACL